MSTKERRTLDKALQHLKDAKKLLRRPERWGKGSFATDAEGRAVPSHSKKAVCFCALGAVRHVSKLKSIPPWYLKTIDVLGRAIPEDKAFLSRAVSYNDDPNTTHADIMALFSRAIAALKAEIKTHET